VEWVGVLGVGRGRVTGGDGGGGEVPL